MTSSLPSDAENVSVFLVDDHTMTRAGMRSLVNGLEGFEVIGDHGDAREAIERIGRSHPDLVLLDITMPGLSGIDAIGMIRDVHARVKILMLSHHEGETFVEQSLQHGADGYLSKDSEPDELAVGMRAVMRGQAYISPKVTRGLVDARRDMRDSRSPGSTRIARLTTREREVFQLLALGFANKEVARKLDMSIGTAKKHRENLQRKLDCRSTAELARLAIREGLLEG
jgi:DNA-binding NarL/FixJ family response regulator